MHIHLVLLNAHLLVKVGERLKRLSATRCVTKAKMLRIDLVKKSVILSCK